MSVYGNNSYNHRVYSPGGGDEGRLPSRRQAGGSSWEENRDPSVSPPRAPRVGGRQRTRGRLQAELQSRQPEQKQIGVAGDGSNRRVGGRRQGGGDPARLSPSRRRRPHSREARSALSSPRVKAEEAESIGCGGGCGGRACRSCRVERVSLGHWRRWASGAREYFVVHGINTGRAWEKNALAGLTTPADILEEAARIMEHREERERSQERRAQREADEAEARTKREIDHYSTLEREKAVAIEALVDMKSHEIESQERALLRQAALAGKRLGEKAGKLTAMEARIEAKVTSECLIRASFMPHPTLPQGCGAPNFRRLFVLRWRTRRP